MRCSLRTALVTLIITAVLAAIAFNVWEVPRQRHRAALRTAAEEGRAQADKVWNGNWAHWQVSNIDSGSIELSIRASVLYPVDPRPQLRPSDPYAPPNRRQPRMCLNGDLDHAHYRAFVARLLDIARPLKPLVDRRWLMRPDDLAAATQTQTPLQTASSPDGRGVTLHGNLLTISWPGHDPVEIRTGADHVSVAFDDATSCVRLALWCKGRVLSYLNVAPRIVLQDVVVARTPCAGGCPGGWWHVHEDP